MADTKARILAKIIDTSGNVVVPNAGSTALDLGIVKTDGSKIGHLTAGALEISKATVGNCAGIIPNGNCSTAVTNGYIDSTYNTSTTYEDVDGTYKNNVNIPVPPDGNWWQWASKGFTGIPTSNCANNGSYDGAGGNTSALTTAATWATKIYDSWGSTTAELGGTYKSREVKNCNCGSFNCRTNCNCNCACACAC